jgi:hypothetical protein
MPLFEDQQDATRHATMCAAIYRAPIGVEKTGQNLWEASEAAATPFAVFIAYPDPETLG